MDFKNISYYIKAYQILLYKRIPNITSHIVQHEIMVLRNISISLQHYHHNKVQKHLPTIVFEIGRGCIAINMSILPY